MTLRGIFSASFYSGRRNKNEVYKEEEKHLLNRLGNKEGGVGGGGVFIRRLLQKVTKRA